MPIDILLHKQAPGTNVIHLVYKNFLKSNKECERLTFQNHIKNQYQKLTLTAIMLKGISEKEKKERFKVLHISKQLSGTE